MDSFFSYLIEKLKVLVEGVGILVKLSLGLGAMTLGFYFLKIKYMPVDLTLGDGLVYIVISLKLFFIIIFFTLLHFVAGKLCAFILIPFVKLWQFFFLNKKNSKKKLKKESKFRRLFKHAKVRNVTVISRFGKLVVTKVQTIFLYSLGIISSILIYTIFYPEFNLSAVISLFFCALVSAKTITEIFSVLKKEEVDDIFGNNRNKKLFNWIGFLFIAPMIYLMVYKDSYNTNVFLDGAAQTVIEKAPKSIIYIKKSYITILDENLVKVAVPVQQNNKDELLRVEGLSVLLRGIGKNALLGYGKNNNTQRVEIPNDALFIKYIELPVQRSSTQKQK